MPKRWWIYVVILMQTRVQTHFFYQVTNLCTTSGRLKGMSSSLPSLEVANSKPLLTTYTLCKWTRRQNFSQKCHKLPPMSFGSGAPALYWKLKARTKGKGKNPVLSRKPEAQKRTFIVYLVVSSIFGFLRTSTWRGTVSPTKEAGLSNSFL